MFRLLRQAVSDRRPIPWLLLENVRSCDTLKYHASPLYVTSNVNRGCQIGNEYRCVCTLLTVAAPSRACAFTTQHYVQNLVYTARRRGGFLSRHTAIEKLLIQNYQRVAPSLSLYATTHSTAGMLFNRHDQLEGGQRGGGKDGAAAQIF